jgi:hypothetical protein
MSTFSKVIWVGLQFVKELGLAVSISSCLGLRRNPVSIFERACCFISLIFLEFDPMEDIELLE